jgi:hypothetical protein
MFPNRFTFSIFQHASEKTLEKYIGSSDSWNWEIMTDRVSNLSTEKLSLDFVKRHMDKPWDFERLTPYFSFDFIEKFITKPWSWEYLTSTVSFDFIKKHMDKLYRWNYHELTFNLSVTEDFIIEHIDEDWNIFEIYDPYISDLWIDKHSKDWCGWDTLILFIYITPECIEKYIYKFQNLCALSENPNVTAEFIERHPEVMRTTFEKNPNITPEFADKFNLHIKFPEEPRYGIKKFF